MGSLRAQGNGNSTTSSLPTQCGGVRKGLPAGWWLHPPQAFLAWALGREDRLCLEQALAHPFSVWGWSPTEAAGGHPTWRPPCHLLPFLFYVGMSPPAHPPGVEGKGR